MSRVDPRWDRRGKRAAPETARRSRPETRTTPAPEAGLSRPSASPPVKMCRPDLRADLRGRQAGGRSRAAALPARVSGGDGVAGGRPGGEPGAPAAPRSPSPARPDHDLIERSFLEERRRTKIIPRFFDERSCLKLVYATLVRASQRWQRIRITEVEREQLLRLRQELGLRPQQIRTPRPKEGKRVKEAVAA